MLKVVVNCGLAEEFVGDCLRSLQMQSFGDWEAYVTVDQLGDRTAAVARETAGTDRRIQVMQNGVRRFPMANVIRAIGRSSAAPDDCIVILDGDDWLIDEHALARIAGLHARSDVWMTYGSWVSNRPANPGRWPPYPDGTTDFRGAPWLGTAIRTWKKWLWDLVDDADRLDQDGHYFRVTEDLACMFPMLEMSTTGHAIHIPEALMLYNRYSRHDDGDAMCREGNRNTEFLRARRPYAPLAQRPDSQETTERRLEVVEVQHGDELEKGWLE
jgi:glycosyltransferase involved in cell wall biosynthesis